MTEPGQLQFRPRPGPRHPAPTPSLDEGPPPSEPRKSPQPSRQATPASKRRARPAAPTAPATTPTPAPTWELEQWGCRLRVDQVDWLRQVTRIWNRELEDQA